jgi:hypothetical protein
MTITRTVLTNLYQPDPALVQDAEAVIAGFEQSIVPSAWPFLDKATVLAEIRQRLQNPLQVCQGRQPFCGPAAVLYELARKQPRHYAEICQSLFFTGGFSGANQFILASDRLRQESYGDLQMGQADWMVLATLREMENILFPVEPNSPELIRNLAGMTKSWELKGWVQELFGYPTVEIEYAFLLDDLKALSKAAKVLEQDGVAFALITAEGMLTDKFLPIPYPSHWVTLLGNIAITQDTVSFDIYTWAQSMRLSMDTASFRRYFWATVTGGSA